jgi:hypothetical protein
MALKPDLIGKVSAFFGITNTITAFIFFSLLFIVLILIHFSVRLSKLTTQMKDIAQQIALLDSDQVELSRLLENKDSEESTNGNIDRQDTIDETIQQVTIEDQEPGA